MLPLAHLTRPQATLLCTQKGKHKEARLQQTMVHSLDRRRRSSTHCRDSDNHDKRQIPTTRDEAVIFCLIANRAPVWYGPPFFYVLIATAIATILEQPGRGLPHISPSWRRAEKVQGRSILSRDTTSKRCFLLHLVPSSICHGIWFVDLRDQSNGGDGKKTSSA